MFTSRSYQNLQNPISFVERRLSPIAKEAGILTTRKDDLVTRIGNFDYFPVIEALWKEPDRKVRVEFLREHAGLHPLLMLEQAVAEFAHSPTRETLYSSISLIFAAIFRVRQDSYCSEDPSISNGDAPVRLRMTYFQSLKKIAEKNSLDLDRIIGEDQAQIESLGKERISQVAQQTLSSSLPSPKWIGPSGMSSFFGEIKFKSVEECESIRKTYGFAQFNNPTL